VAYAGLLSIGVPGFRLGILNGGPVALNPDFEWPDEALSAFWKRLRKLGYFCVRFSCTPSAVWSRIRSTCAVDSRDPFPWYAGTDHDLVVEQRESDEDTLADFKKHARQEIKKAALLGYEIETTDAPEAIRNAWSLVDAMERRKGRRFYRRRAESYMRLVDLAAKHGCARIYLTRLGGRLLQIILLVRNRDTAHYILGAVDVAALNGALSPSCLTHWTAMRDFYREGVPSYSLGNDIGPLHLFKGKFSPRRVEYPPNAAAVLIAPLYSVWTQICKLLS
jgi:hypothetical protein